MIEFKTTQTVFDSEQGYGFITLTFRISLRKSQKGVVYNTFIVSAICENGDDVTEEFEMPYHDVYRLALDKWFESVHRSCRPYDYA